MMRILKMPLFCQCHRPFRGQSSKVTDIPEGVVICFDNPLLDITKTVKDKVILQKYALADDAAIVATKKHMPLFEELSKMEDVIYTAGGAGQNAMRIFQWIVTKPFCAYFVGAVGMDKVGETMAKKAMEDGVRTIYQITCKAPTGSCAVIVNGFNRSLVANLGAATTFSEDWFDDELHCCYLNQARYFYIPGYFISVNASAVLKIAKISSASNRTFLLNFSSIETLKTKTAQVDEILSYTDVLIGNKQEALAYADTHDWETTDIVEIGRRLQCLPKNNNKRPRVVLITDSKWPVLCFQENEEPMKYPVPEAKERVIVDTNGCGDAFVGGLLSQLVQKKSLAHSIRTGIFAAQQVLYIVGIQIDKLPKFKGIC